MRMAPRNRQGNVSGTKGQAVLTTRKPRPVAPVIGIGHDPEIGNQREASDILHERFGEDAHVGPPEDLDPATGDASPALRLLTRWFSAAAGDDPKTAA